jgi:signal transduction histidine kinase
MHGGGRTDISAPHWLELLEAQAEALRAAFLVVDADGTLFAYNERFLSQWGVPAHVLERRKLSELAEWLDAVGDEPAEQLARLLLSPDPSQAGEVYYSSTGDMLSLRIVDLPGGGKVWAFHNAREIQHLIQGLRDAGDLLRLLEGHIDGIVLELDPDHRVVGIWAPDDSFFEESDRALQGKRITEVFGPEQGGTIDGVVRHLFSTGAPKSFEYTLDIRGERKFFTADARLMPSGDEEEPRVTLQIRDVTERTRMQRKLLEAERLASVGLLAAGVAHEVNNPLAYTLLNLERIQSGLRELSRPDSSELLDELQTAVEMSLEGARRVQTIVQDLRRFSRSDRHDPLVPVDVREMIEFAIDMAAHATRERARVVRDFGDVPFVMASETRLTQVFLNLIVNAAQAIPAGKPEENEIRVVTRAVGTERAVIEVHDTGAGMTPAILEHIFEPFFTTKPAGDGTGLGLAICQGIATSLGGEIAVESQPGRGSVFRLFLPAAEPPEGRRARTTPPP